MTSFSNIRAVFFDAVGTLIYPWPPVAEVYARLGSEFGVMLSLAEIQRRFHAAFARQEQEDLRQGSRTDEDRERRRWADIVAEVFFDQPNSLGALDPLWNHFGRPEAWRCFTEVASVLDGLRARGVALGIASNFDQRLRAVRAGLPALQHCAYLVISSEIGWRKPAPEFFRRLCAQGPWRPRDVLFVGDDPKNDVEAAAAFGMNAVLLTRREGDIAPAALRTLARLPELLAG